MANFPVFHETGKYKFIGFMFKTCEKEDFSRKSRPETLSLPRKNRPLPPWHARPRGGTPPQKPCRPAGKAPRLCGESACAFLEKMKNNPTQETLPKFDLPVPFIAGDYITAEILNLYQPAPCRIEACIFALCAKGSIRVHINLKEYLIKENDIVVLAPGSFIQVHESSPDCQVGFIGFSAGIMKESGFQKNLSPYMPLLLDKPVLPLAPPDAGLCRDAAALLARVQERRDISLDHRMLGHIMGLFTESIRLLYDRQADEKGTYRTRDREILGEFLQLAFENYREEHKVLFYAQAAGLTLSHFCSVISRTSGQTAQEILKSLIIIDAKAQLRNTKATVTQIAYSLGFHTPTTFNRYFRTYTGTTPQEYRNNPL